MQALVVQHVACEGPGLLQDVLVGKGWGLDIRCMDQPGANLPESVGNHDAFVILGGRWELTRKRVILIFSGVQELIREAVALRLPALGICLGGQLIARALGAKVEPNPVKEIGWYKVRLTSAGRLVPLFTGMPPELLVFSGTAIRLLYPKVRFCLPPVIRALTRHSSTGRMLTAVTHGRFNSTRKYPQK